MDGANAFTVGMESSYLKELEAPVFCSPALFVQVAVAVAVAESGVV